MNWGGHGRPSEAEKTLARRGGAWLPLVNWGLRRPSQAEREASAPSRAVRHGIGADRNRINLANKVLLLLNFL